MEKLKILVVDDEFRMRKLIKDFLVKNEYEVVEAENGEEAISLFKSDKKISLIVLDVLMPKLDGFETLVEIRKLSKIPVIMLTAKTEEKDELQGFKLGVDEYISKPFSPKVLVARIEAILRRSYQNLSEDILTCGNISLNTSAHIAMVGETLMELSYKEFELLKYFMENQGIALSRDQILNSVWNYDYFGDARTIDTHVKKLRSKMMGEGDRIKTIWGIGYKMEVE